MEWRRGRHRWEAWVPDLPPIQHHHIAMHTLTLFHLPTQTPSQALSPMMDGMGEDICMSFVPHDRSFFSLAVWHTRSNPPLKATTGYPTHSLSTFLYWPGQPAAVPPPSSWSNLRRKAATENRCEAPKLVTLGGGSKKVTAARRAMKRPSEARYGRIGHGDTLAMVPPALPIPMRRPLSLDVGQRQHHLVGPASPHTIATKLPMSNIESNHRSSVGIIIASPALAGM